MKAISNWNEFEAEVSGQHGTVLVDFFTDGCGPCRMMNPLLEEVARERTDIRIVKVDAAANAETAARFRIQGVPTFILFNEGEARAQFTGARSKKDLLTWIEANR